MQAILSQASWGKQRIENKTVSYFNLGWLYASEQIVQHEVGLLLVVS